jgi:hypothetical protein
MYGPPPERGFCECQVLSALEIERPEVPPSEHSLWYAHIFEIILVLASYTSVKLFNRRYSTFSL